MKVTNMRREGSVDFTIPVKGDNPKIVSILAGESGNVDLKEDDPQVQAYLHSQQIAIGAEAAKAAAPAAKSTAS